MFFERIELQQVAPPTLTPRCGACGLYKTCQSPKMEPTGSGRKKVLIVAEAPGKDEDREGVQLVGKSGQYLIKVLKAIGVDMRQDCWLTNALICRPPNNEIPKKKADAMIAWCRPNLLRTIEELDPDVIIPLGTVAVKSLIGHCWSRDVGTITRWVGWRIPAQKVNAWICPTWHPAFLLRMESRVLESHFRHHLKQAFRLQGKPWQVVPDYSSNISLVYDVDEAAEILSRIREGTIAFDYEANMLKPESDRSRIVCCSVCWDPEHTISFPYHGAVADELRRLLSDKRVKKIASNLKYEDRWTRKHLGVRVRGWFWDTMLAAHLLDCRADITSIKFLSFAYLGQPRYDTQVEPYLKSKVQGGNEVNRVDKIGLDKLMLYNGLDSLLEFLVAEKQMKEMNHAKVEPDTEEVRKG